MLNYSDTKDTKDTKTRSYVVQLGSSTLILSKTNPCSDVEGQEIMNQMTELEEQKRLYNQVFEKKEPLASSERRILVRGGDLGKSGPGPRAKAAARINAQSSGSFLIPGADGFMPSGNFRAYQNPLSARRPGKIQKGPFNPDQDQRKSRCKSNREQTEKYTIESKIRESNTLSKISTKVRKDKETRY